MSRMWATLCVVFIVNGCAYWSEPISPAEQEQRAIFEGKHQQELEAERQARVQRELDQLKQEVDEHKRKQQAARRTPPPAERTPPPSEPVAAANPAPESAMSGVARLDSSATLKELNALLGKRSIYYDYDTYNVREDFKSVLEAHARFLMEHKDMVLRIEGNTDDRGSREYNLALGQRRADAVKRALLLLGVAANQIQTVSFGPEKPKLNRHDERAWAENRRSDLLYVGHEEGQSATTGARE